MHGVLVCLFFGIPFFFFFFKVNEKEEELLKYIWFTWISQPSGCCNQSSAVSALFPTQTANKAMVTAH